MHAGADQHGNATPLVLIGGGGHAKVVLDAARASGWRIVGFLDDAADAALCRLGIERLGSIQDWVRCNESCRFIPALGDNTSRRARIESIIEQAAHRLAPVVHPTAVVSRCQVTLGRGVFISAGAIINACASIGDGAIINTGAIIEHDSRIGAWAHVAPGAALGGAVEIGEESLIGLGSRILPGVRIGSHSTIAAGAVVTRNVPEHTTVRGVPARVM